MTSFPVLSSDRFKFKNFSQTEIGELVKKSSAATTNTTYPKLQQSNLSYSNPQQGYPILKNQQLFNGQLDLENDIKVQFSVQACSSNIEQRENQSQILSNRLIVVPKVQKLDQVLQFSVDFSFGNQKQSINFDIDIRNQIQEKFCDQISSGQICQCHQSQLTYSKLQELDKHSISYNQERPKLRKGSCYSEQSDATLINEPNYHHIHNLNYYPLILEEKLEDPLQPAILFQKFQNFDNSKSELPEQKSQFKFFNKNKCQLPINQTNNICHNNNNNQISHPYQIQQSTNQKLKQLKIQENPSHSVAQTDKQQKAINTLSDNLINNERSTASQNEIIFSSDLNLITKEEIYNIIEHEFGYEILSSKNSTNCNSSTSRVTEDQFILKSQIKNENGYLGSNNVLKNQKIFEELQSGSKTETSKFGMELNYSKDIQDDLDEDISYTEEYLARAEKKNVVKNFVKAFKTYLNDDSNQRSIMNLLEMESVAEVEQLKTRFKSYLKKKKFNNKLIKDLLVNQSYSSVFEFWLLNYAKEWLYQHSKVGNKSSHFIMLKYFIQCIGQPDLLDKLKVLKNTKKQQHQLQQFPSSTNYLLSTPIEGSRFDQCYHVCQSFTSNQNTCSQLDSEQQSLSQQQKLFEPISISTFTTLPIPNAQQL